MHTEKKYDTLVNENINLRKQAALNAQIGEFVSGIYDLRDVGDVFDSLVKHLNELTTFDKMIYLRFLPDTAELKVDFSQGYSREEKLHFSFDIFEIPDKNIISAIFEKKTAVIKNGIDAVNDLSVRLDIDNYVMVPMILHAEDEKLSNEVAVENKFAAQNEEGETIPFIQLREMLKIVDFSVAGIFIFDCGAKIEDLEKDDDILLAQKLIRLAGMAINNILVLNDLRRTAKKNQKELEAARMVQEKLLPEKLPCDNVLQAFAFYIPVEEVGGDYYDLFLLKPGVYAVFVADVSGHGVSAALVMSAAKILLKTIASAELSPAQTLRKVNEELVSHIPANRFLTAFYAIIDTKKHKMTYTCAGHCPILLFNKKSREYEQFQSDGFFIGMFPELELPNHEYHYKKGENRLCLYTDGVVDCFNKEKAQFSLIRLKTIIAQTLDISGEMVIEEVKSNIRDFVGKRELEDDLTLLIVDF